MKGIILKGIGGFYYVKVKEEIYECKARGIFRKKALAPLAGDRCEIDELQNGTGNIVSIDDRKNQLVRPPIANIDQMVIVAAAANPAPVAEFIDKLTIVATEKQIKPIIVINKIDLVSDKSQIQTLTDAYCKAGYPTFCISAASGEGVEDIFRILQDKITVFAGCSGVGKSSLINALNPRHCLETGELSAKIQRGKHTTRCVELFELEHGGFIADSPGFSSLEITNYRAADLETYFPEFLPFLGKCRYRGCSHIHEPDCAVKQAVADGYIGLSRYESYKKFYEILKEIKEWQR